MSPQNHPEKYIVYRWKEASAPLDQVVVTWKDPQPGEVVIKVLACGVCGSDHLVHTGVLGFPFPRVPGHEIVGDIAAVHPSETMYKVGQRVGAPWVSGYCGECSACKKGVFTACVNGSNWRAGGSIDGGYAQYVTIPTKGICSVPEDMDPAEAAPLFCAGVTCHKGIEHLNIKPSSTVAVQSIGGLGHLAIQYCRAMGFRTIAISSSAAKRDLALELGAHIFIDESKQDTVQELQKVGGADAIVATAPSAAAMLKLIPGLAYGGKLLILGLPDDSVSFMPITLAGKRWSLHGYLCGTARDCHDTIQFSKLHNIKVLVDRFPLQHAQQALDHRPNARFRSVLVPHENST